MIASVTRRIFFLSFVGLLFIALAISATAEAQETAIDPAVYLNFNEGSGVVAFDASGHGNAGMLHNVSRIGNGGCGGALAFDRPGNYVSIPYRAGNHPEKEITVSAWFYADSFAPQDLISTDNSGGYRLAFGDGGDLWWTVNLRGTGEVSVPVQHEGITPRQWHHVTGTYDGRTTKIYLDGVLRNQINATGPIVYEYPNYVILGARAGAFDAPDAACPRSFHGGLDEVRIYEQAIPYSQIMDDRFGCSQELIAPSQERQPAEMANPACITNSGSIRLGPGESTTRTLTFTDRIANGTWNVAVPPGSKLLVKAEDAYSQVAPDAWYVEVADETGKRDRSIAFPNTNNAPVGGSIPSGNAIVTVRYFDGMERFPASVSVQFTCIPPPLSLPQNPQNILANPIIVIYSASWATLIALVLVILWLHQRRQKRKEREKENGKTGEDKKND